MLLCYSINTGVVLLFTSKWKISVHTTGLSGPVGALILLLGPVGALFGIIYPVLIWSRVTLNKHTMAQAICGGVQGFFLTVLEFYLFNWLFKFNILNLTPLDSCVWYILAIIATPIVLGILSYINIGNKKIVFVLFEIIALILFLIFIPLNITDIFILVSFTCILVSYYDKEFVWYDILGMKK